MDLSEEEVGHAFHVSLLLHVAGAAAAPHVGSPAGVTPGQPGPLGLADRSLIADGLERAGFRLVEIEELTGSMRIGTNGDDAVPVHPLNTHGP